MLQEKRVELERIIKGVYLENIIMKNNLAYICAEILADSLVLEANLNTTETFEIDDVKLFVSITKV